MRAVCFAIGGPPFGKEVKDRPKHIKAPGEWSQRLDPIRGKSDLRRGERDLRVTDSDLWVTDSDLWVTDLDLWVTDLDLWVTDLDLQVTDLDLQVTVLDLQVADLDLQVMDLDLQVTDLDPRVISKTFLFARTAGILNLSKNSATLKGDLRSPFHAAAREASSRRA
jgi:hypothetical protein